MKRFPVRIVPGYIRSIVLIIHLMLLSSTAIALDWTCKTTSAAWSEREMFGLFSYNDSLWIFCGRGNTMPRDAWNSQDGVNWRSVCDSVPFPMNTNVGCIVFQNKMWVLGGEEGC